MYRIISLVFSIVIFLLSSVSVSAHGTVERNTEEWPAQGRLFVADANNGDLAIIDLPEGNVVARLSTPPYIMSLGLTPDSRHLFVTRGRNTETDHVTVVNTAFDTITGKAGLPFISRTFEGFSPSGARHGYMTSIGGAASMVNESKAELLTFDGNFDGLGAVSVRKYELAGSAHYHYAEAEGYIYVGHLQQGLVQILDRETGDEVARLNGCPVLHGIAHDNESGRMFFACQNNTLVVGTRGAEAKQIVSRISYPEKQRVAAFMEGKERIFWGYTEGTLPMLYRLDAGRQPYTYETVPVASSVRQAISADKSYLLILNRDGKLEIRNSANGELLRSVVVGKGWSADFHEHTDKAILPDIVTLGSHAYVSLPDEGIIAQIDLDNGKLIRNLNIGGQPTRMVVLAQVDSHLEEALALNVTEALIQRGDQSFKITTSSLFKDHLVWIRLRDAAEAIGARIEWLAESSGIVITKDSQNIRLVIGNTFVEVNGIRKAMNDAPLIVEGNTYMNTIDLSELLGIRIVFDEATQNGGKHNENHKPNSTHDNEHEHEHEH
ncbi:stalk domain-containing protein [Paenibacillus silviterrae]|uniref:stalk domain-containing protein n=1 Tax=Paenibacillus silviterrae TaxID=3242194 RepID=UPI002542F799|nr:stalk domain-containing protein [Paenibacillus chinjuensis]